MSCVHCVHCQQLASVADLRLPPVGSSTFYPRFATAYGRARERSGWPGRAIREANPGLSVEQVRWYRRRCVELGLLARTRESKLPATAPVAEDVAGGVTVHPDLARSLAHGQPLSVQLVKWTTPHRSDAAAAAYLSELQSAGLV